MIPVSRETEKLMIYARLLRKWQGSINLVGPDTIDVLEQRHFQDSAILLSHLTGTTLLDFGSGAGFPGMIVAMYRPDITVSLMESDQKKCSFLKTVSRETDTAVKIINERIEAYPPFKVDMITARALAPLSKLLKFSEPYGRLNPELNCFFMKGRDWKLELESIDPQIRPRIEIIRGISENSVVLRMKPFKTLED